MVELAVENGARFFFWALSTRTRWKIVEIIRKTPLDISALAKVLNQSQANISAQIKILEKAGIVDAHYEPGNHGVSKVCEIHPDYREIIIKL